MTNKPIYDDGAHSLLTVLLDETEQHLVRRRKCEPQYANNHLALDYIMRCAGICNGATTYYSGDERVGTSLFISSLRGPKQTRLRTGRCVDQLINFPTFYFPEYLIVLRMAYLRELPNMKTSDMIQLSGLLKLAAASLPGVRSDVRRELRRRGRGADAIIVCDDDFERKMAISRVEILKIT